MKKFIFLLAILVIFSSRGFAGITKYSNTEYQKTREVSEVMDIKKSKHRIMAINEEIDSLQARIQSLRAEKTALQADIDEAKLLGVIDPVVE